MKHISIPKIGFGILLTLVLAFSVQGTADAQTIIKESSGDHQHQSPGLAFNSPLVFSASGVEAETVQIPGGSTTPTVSAPADGTIVITANTNVAITSVSISGKTAYIPESVTASNSVTLSRPYKIEYIDNSADPPVKGTATNAKPHVDAVNDYNKNGNTLKSGSNTINVSCRAITAGIGTVTVTGKDAPFTLYVSAPGESAGRLIDDSGSPNENGDYSNIIRQSFEGPISFATASTVAGNLVEFKVISGSGKFYFDNDDRNSAKSSYLVGITAGGSASIRFSPPSSGVTVVQAALIGTNQRAFQTFYSNFPNIIKIDDVAGRTGVIGTRLADPFTVEVRDGTTGTRVPNQEIQFMLTFTDGSNTNLNGAMLTSAADSTITGSPSLTLQSDSRGRASVYLTLGRDTTNDPAQDIGTYTLTVTLQDSANNNWDTERFTAKSVGETQDAIIEIVSGDKDRVDPSSGAHPSQLVVRVLNRNRQIVQGESVTFRATVGTVTGNPGATPSGSASEGQFVTQTTDEFGQAAVTFVIGDTSGDATVRAVINPATQHEQGVTFTVYGRGSTGGSGNQNNQNQNQNNQNNQIAAVVPSSVTGSADGTATLRITAPANAVVTVGNALRETQGLDTFPRANASAPTRSGTTVTSRLTLPSQVGTYPLTVTVGGTKYRVSVVVTAAAAGQSSGRLTVSVDPFNGAPGSTATVRVSATDADGDPANITVRLSATNGVLSASSVETGTEGTDDSIRIVRGSTAGTENYVTVNGPSGYESGRGRFIIAAPASGTGVSAQDTDTGTGGTQTTSTVSGSPSSIEIEGSRRIDGRLAQALRLRARVLDANDRGVSGVGVTFRVIAPGQGTFAGARGSGRAIRIETDGSGDVSTNFTPTRATSTGTITVEAKAAGVSATVSFIIDVDGGTTPRETSDTTDGRTYQVGDKVPISLQDTLTFRGSRTLNGTSYTCVGSGECVVSYGTLVKGEIAAAAVPKVQAKTYKTGEKIPISLTATLTFSGKHTLGGTVYTCVSDGECVVSYGILTKGEIEVSTVSTPSASDSPGMSDAKAVVGAANRPVMYWIAGGGLYRLAGASAEQIAERATDVAVGSDKLYWIEEKTARTGAVHQADLDGSNASVVKELTSAPKGLALANGKLYITNGWGKIQRMNVDGTQFETNFLTNLGAPLGIAVSGSRVYWTDGSGRVRSAPLQGTKAIQNIVTGSGTLGGIVADGSKVYWTEQTGERSGRIRAANLDGTGITNAYTVTATVHGLALDPGNQQLYWTNGWGKVQRGVRGSRYQDVVTGLMTPTALAIGGANTATPMPATKPVQPAAEPNYDVDGSGTVDNADLFLVSLAVGTDNAKYDVNGDGTVDAKDIALVRDNRDAGAAGAPLVVGVKLTAEQVGRLQAQIDLLIVSGDRSPAVLKTLVYLQQLIATARPEQTQLLANYPNPFNPETWIPYELATDTDVRITIYAANGVVVRTLQLGQQSAGYYTDRERAAYWDGRNASGEQVASGVYFYQLETDEISSLRKMVILK